MYYVYIIFSKKLDKKYIGITQNIKKRVYEHKTKQSRFTSSTNDWKLVYYQVFISKKDAHTEEKFLKTGQGRERLKYLLANTLK